MPSGHFNGHEDAMILEYVAKTRPRWALLDHGTPPFLLSASPNTQTLTFPLLNAASTIPLLEYPSPLDRFSSTRSHPSLSLVPLELSTTSLRSQSFQRWQPDFHPSVSLYYRLRMAAADINPKFFWIGSHQQRG